MAESFSYSDARSLAAERVTPVGTERVPLIASSGRVLAQDVIAAYDVPSFDKSPYDGYCFRAEDSVNASEDTPVTLRILEEIPAGGVPHYEVTPGTAVKILTGAPIPPGGDTVVPYERTRFTAEEVTIFAPCKKGSNIVCIGEDIRKGTLLVASGSVIDAGVIGSLSAQSITMPLVYKTPRVGIISTGSELVGLDEELRPGKIHDSNGYSLFCILKELGIEPVYYGPTADTVDDISAALTRALGECDAVVTTGGVSVGDYDLTPAAMEQVGSELLFRRVNMKPGMACAYGINNGKLICALSGNPAASITNLYAIALPALRKLCGIAEYELREFTVTLAEDFNKRSPGNRFLRGTLDLSDGSVRMHIPEGQGNVMLSTVIGTNVMALVPAGSGPVPAGTQLKAFLTGR